MENFDSFHIFFKQTCGDDDLETLLPRSSQICFEKAKWQNERSLTALVDDITQNNFVTNATSDNNMASPESPSMYLRISLILTLSLCSLDIEYLDAT